MRFEQRYIGEILVRRGALEPDKLEDALETAADRAVDLRDFLVATHTVEEDKVVRALADEVGMEFVEKIATDVIPEELVDAVPINFARQNHVLPLTQTDESVRVVIANPLDPFPIDDLRILLGKTIIPVAGVGYGTRVVRGDNHLGWFAAHGIVTHDELGNVYTNIVCHKL